ncbi:MAG TPA: class I SAM-dependent rRNA methyltransferase, partial [Ignavibacteriaceae bacterium]
MNAKIHLRKNEERRIKSGHLWVFSNEIFEVEGEPHNGDLVEVFDHKGNFIGTGFYNRNSLIAVRILTYEKTTDLYEVLKSGITSAYALRKELYPGRESFRLIFSESDFMPGLIIDKYNNTFVLQVYSYGMEKNLGLITRILKEELSAENIFTKNEEYFRKLEGLPPGDEIFLGEIRNEIIFDGAVKYKIDFEKGHKTGFYFDQSDNRFFIQKFVREKRVLDAFCNSGGFGLHAAKAGADEVTFVDSSAGEIENARQNFELNLLSGNREFIVSDVFDYMEKCIAEKKFFDVIMIDPPAFAKNKKSVPAAIKGYEKLNRLAMSTIGNDGFLVTSSCSHHISETDFVQCISRAAIKSGKKI